MNLQMFMKLQTEWTGDPSKRLVIPAQWSFIVFRNEAWNQWSSDVRTRVACRSRTNRLTRIFETRYRPMFWFLSRLAVQVLRINVRSIQKIKRYRGWMVPPPFGVIFNFKYVFSFHRRSKGCILPPLRNIRSCREFPLLDSGRNSLYTDGIFLRWVW